MADQVARASITGIVDLESEQVDFDQVWAGQYLTACSNPWDSGILPLKLIELICVGLFAACTSMREAPSRRHIRAALAAGANADELALVIKMGSIMSIHSLSLGAPILLEEAIAAGLRPALKSSATPYCDKMRELGQWNNAWDPFYNLDPVFTEQIMTAGVGIYSNGVMTPKVIELLSLAFDASITHMYAPDTRRHIKGALAAGATVEEIMEVLKVCVAFGLEACLSGAQILKEEVAGFNK